MSRIAQLQEEKLRTQTAWNAPTQPQAPCSVPAPTVERIEPGFDCGRARHAAEIAICNSNRLAQYDLTINNLYARVKRRLTRSNRKRLARNQRRWLNKRNRCGRNVQCIERAYRQRISVLRTFAGG